MQMNAQHNALSIISLSRRVCDQKYVFQLRSYMNPDNRIHPLLILLLLLCNSRLRCCQSCDRHAER